MKMYCVTDWSNDIQEVEVISTTDKTVTLAETNYRKGPRRAAIESSSHFYGKTREDAAQKKLGWLVENVESYRHSFSRAVSQLDSFKASENL